MRALVGLSELMERRPGVLVHLQSQFWGGRDRQIPEPCWPGSLAYLVHLSSDEDPVSHNIMKNLKACVGPHKTPTHMHMHAQTYTHTCVCINMFIHITIIHSHWPDTNIIYELYLSISVFIHYIAEQHTF